MNDPADVRRAILELVPATLVLVAAALLWRDRGVFSLERVALWIEERVPSLEYSLVTAVETGNPAFVSAVNAERWRGIAIQGRSRLTAGRDRQARSRRLAGSLPKSACFDPRCFTLRIESARGSVPSPGLAEP